MRECRVERSKFAPENTERPTVGNDVVHGDQEGMVILGEADEPASEEWAARQIERRSGLSADEGFELSLWVYAPP